MSKKTILHIIYNLGRGGAETMLVTVVKELHDYNNIVVTLFPENHFGNELKCDKLICLDLKSLMLLPFAAFKLRKIIKKNKVDAVHSHLFWPTVLARIATPKKIPLITTIHVFIATSIEYKIWYIRFLDKITYRLRKNIIVTVAQGALSEYYSFLNLKPYKSYSLHTFVDTDIFYKNGTLAEKNGVCKMISVGALRKQKNHQYLLEAFKGLDNTKYKLDIYGEGSLRNKLKKEIQQNNLNINLCGEVKNIQKLINKYDVFVMSSTYEGFSLSVLEAMAMKMPILVSDINSFREQCENTAEYFDLIDPQNFILKVKNLNSDTQHLKQLGERAYERVVNNFTLQQHMQGLRTIYSEVLSDNQA